MSSPKFAAVVGAIALALLATACAPRSDSVTPLVLESVQTSSVDTSLPVNFRVAEGWRVREMNDSGLWAISERGELKLGTSDPDYVARLAREASLIDGKGFQVVGPLDTQLFGEPAVSTTVTSRQFTRMFVASASWQADSQASHPFDLREANEFAAMLGQGTNFPAPDPR